MPLPLCLPLSHSRPWAFSRAFPQSRADKSPPPSSPPPRALPPRDCPILRPRAGLPLSRACDSPFAMSFGTTLRTRFPSSSRHAVGGCMSASRPLKRPSACSLVWSHISMLPNTHAAYKASLLLSCSQDDRDAHQLCSGEDQGPQRSHHLGRLFARWREDRVGIG